MVNGLESKTNAITLELSAKWDIIRPAAGLYPSYAVSHLLPPEHPWKSADMSHDAPHEAMEQIEALARAGKIVLLGSVAWTAMV